MPSVATAGHNCTAAGSASTLTPGCVCDEPRAESYTEREKANFCDWFKLRREFVEPGETALSGDHQAELNTLFGTDAGVSKTPSDSRTQLDDLFTAPSDDS